MTVYTYAVCSLNYNKPANIVTMVTLVTVVSMGATALETVRVIITKLKVVQTDCFDSNVCSVGSSQADAICTMYVYAHFIITIYIPVVLLRNMVATSSFHGSLYSCS